MVESGNTYLEVIDVKATGEYSHGMMLMIEDTEAKRMINDGDITGPVHLFPACKLGDNCRLVPLTRQPATMRTVCCWSLMGIHAEKTKMFMNPYTSEF
jgi:hypothetical protein